jgi:CBS domain-containing protein
VWRRGYDWLRGSAPGLVPLALLVGVGAVVFRYLIVWFTELFTGRADYSDAGRVASPHFPGLGMFFVVVVPVLGGLVYGPIVDRFAKEARGHGVPEVMLAVAERGGRIAPQVAIVKSLASALCIGCGGSVGREGPIVQIGSALGSSIGQALRLSDARLRLLVACGAIGGSGGVFAPSLFMGTMLGTAYGLAAQHLFGAAVGPAGAYGLVGMGAVFAGAARAPITAVLIIFELTGDYTIILSLMATIALATGASAVLSTDTIYTLKLRRRGIDLLRGKAANPMQLLTVANAMQPTPAALTPETPLNAIIDRLATEGRDALPVVEAGRIYRGTVTARDVEDSARDNALEVTAATLARTVPILHPGQSLEHALGLLVRQDRSGLPVTSSDDGRIVGWLTHRDVLAAYNTGCTKAWHRPRRL